MGSKLHIHLPDGSIAEYKPDHAPLDTDDVIVERREADGRYVIGYLSHDEDASHLAEICDVTSDKHTDGRMLFEVYRRHSGVSEREAADEFFGRLKPFLKDADRDEWEAVVGAGYVEDAAAVGFLRGGSSAAKAVGGDFALYMNGNHLFSGRDGEIVDALLSAIDNGVSGEEPESLAEVLDEMGYGKGEKVPPEFITVEFEGLDNVDQGLHRLVAALRQAGAPIWGVECYQHGNVHYSIAGTRNYPDRQWDVGYAGYFMPPRDVVEEVLKGERSLDGAAKYATAMLEQYNDWRNGNVYGVVCEVVEVAGTEEDGFEVEQVESDAVWGHVGGDYAEGELAERVAFELMDGIEDRDTPEGRLAALRQVAATAASKEVRLACVKGIADMHGQWLKGAAANVRMGLAVGGARGDLSGLDASGADLSGRNLSGIVANGARLVGANLSECVVDGGSFRWANLQGADLVGAKLSGAIDLSEACLRAAKLPPGILEADVDLTGADLHAARVGKDDLENLLPGARLAP